MSAHYVYELLSADGSHLYIGVTSNIAQRLRQHMIKAWFADVRSINVRWHQNESAARAAEAALIRERQPVHNDALTDHATKSRRLPCRACRTGKHVGCLQFNSRNLACECTVCEAIA